MAIEDRLGSSFVEEPESIPGPAVRVKATNRRGDVVTVRLYQNSVLRRATIGRFRLALSAVSIRGPKAANGAAKSQADHNPASLPNRRPSATVCRPASRRALRTEPGERDEDSGKPSTNSLPGVFRSCGRHSP